jgi:hypothetical protein
VEKVGSFTYINLGNAKKLAGVEILANLRLIGQNLKENV